VRTSRFFFVPPLLLLAGCTHETRPFRLDQGSAEQQPGASNDVPFDPGGQAPAGEASACSAVDVIFAVDNSGSMQEEKAALVGIVFPAFAAKLAAIATVESFRAAVLDACPQPANFHKRGATGECGFAGGSAWMDSATPVDLLTKEFACVADIYAGDVECSGNNDDEQPAVAAATSLEAPWKESDNAGFLRDEALLVIVAITDEDETPVPAQSPAQLVARILSAKGDPSRVVFLGIGGSSACDSGAYGSAKHAKQLQELTALFTAPSHGYFWDLCAGGLEQGLGQALAIVEQACGEVAPLL
jgi:hypothetical protein